MPAPGAPPAPPLDPLSQLLVSIKPPSDDQYGPMALPAAPGPAMASAAPPPSPAPPVQPVAAPPSDDLAKYQKGMDDAQSTLADKVQRIRGLQDQNAALTPPNPADYKPKWWQRLLGGVVGTAAGYGHPELAGPAASNVVNRDFNQAQAQYEPKHKALLDQLSAEKDDFPIYKDMADLAHRQLEGARATANEKRLEKKDADMADFHDQVVDIKDKMADIGRQNALDRIGMLEKQLNERAEHNKQTMDLQQQLLDLKKEALDKKEEKGKSNTQSVLIEDRKSKALAKAERDYRRAVAELGPNDEKGQQEALDNLNADKDAAQTTYLNEIVANGGSIAKPDASKPATGKSQPAPSAAPGKGANPSQAAAPPSTLWKNREGKILTLKNPSSGKEEKWQLVNGNPQMVTGAR